MDRLFRLHGLIDARRVAVAGHSDDGETAFAVAYERRYLDPRVHAAVVLSGAELAPDTLSSRPHERVTIAFLNHYVKQRALRPLLAAGNSEHSLARLTSRP